MDTSLEEKRSLHEKRDRIEQALVDEILNKKSSHREILESEHRQKYLLDEYKTCSEKLLHLYQQPQTTDSLDVYKNFYCALRQICLTKDENLIELIDYSAPDQHIEFTDEENYGKYLDMTKCHEEYLQVIKREETKPNYLEFLEKFDKFEVEPALKSASAYKNYLETLLGYFRDFSRRAKPLFDHHEMETNIDQKLAQEWKSNLAEGSAMVDLDSYRSSQELMELGLDCLKKELQVRGLKCGGTIEERANRLWSVRGKSEDQIDESLKAGSVRGKKGKKKTNTDPFQVKLIEAKVAAYAEYFNDHRQATIENVQRKQARTADERNESDEEVSDIEDDDQEDGDVVYNPKNLPLGWDGKPIPYWLYKLHGLNLTFTCEICGNATYKGPKTFQRHFAEWRHAHGMRCLDIPNTAHFANITKIQDAITLWEKLKVEKQKDKFQPLNEEEYEDSQGNVVNKKTYEDLKRQGLLWFWFVSEIILSSADSSHNWPNSASIALNFKP